MTDPQIDLSKAKPFIFELSFDAEDMAERRRQKIEERERQEAEAAAAAAVDAAPTFSEEDLAAAKAQAYEEGRAAGLADASSQREAGLAGILDTSGGSSAHPLEDLAARLGASLEHRGPDGHGVWADLTAGIALAHQRLAILDLSAAGHQPMHSQDGRFVLSYNGELYSLGQFDSGLGLYANKSYLDAAGVRMVSGRTSQ